MLVVWWWWCGGGGVVVVVVVVVLGPPVQTGNRYKIKLLFTNQTQLKMDVVANSVHH